MDTPTATAPPAGPTGAATGHDRWVKSFAARPDLLQAPDRLVAMRREALYRLSQTPFPTRRDEDWRYSDFTTALRLNFELSDALTETLDREAFQIPELDAYVLVTVDGAYRPELSDAVPGLHVSTVEEAIEVEPHAFWLDRTCAGLHAPSQNAFVALNAAFAKRSLYIAGAKNARCDKPLHLVHVATRTRAHRMVCTQVMVMMPGGADLTITETFATVGQGAAIFRNHVVRAGLASNARLAYRSIQDEALGDYHHSNTEADQQRDSTFDHARVDLGGLQVRNNLAVVHKAESVETHLAGLYFARGRQRIDNQTFIDHAYPHGESNELYKGIVMERGVTSFNGKVMVRPDAQKTNAFQQNDNLVVGKRAEANAKPQLEIFADDVKCSHGATIGQLDEEPLYYLMARGIDRATAFGMLQRGFLLEVLETIENEAIRAYVEALLQSKFNA